MAGGGWGRKAGWGRQDHLHQSDRLWDQEEFWLQLIEAVIKVSKIHRNSGPSRRVRWIAVASMLESDCGISLSSGQVLYLKRSFSRLKCQEERGFPDGPVRGLDFATPLVMEKVQEYVQEFLSIKAIDDKEPCHDFEAHTEFEPASGPLFIEARHDVKASPGLELEVKASPGLELEVEPAPRRYRNGRKGSVAGDHASITQGSGDCGSFSPGEFRRSARNVNKPKPTYFPKEPEIGERPVTMKLPESSPSVKRKLEKGLFPSSGGRGAEKKEEAGSCFTEPSETLSPSGPSDCNEVEMDVEMDNVQLMDEYFDDLQAMICDRLIPTAKRDARERLTSKGPMRAAKKVRLLFPKGRNDEGDNCYPHRISHRDMECVGAKIFSIVMQTTARASYHLKDSGVEERRATDSRFVREFDELNRKVSALLKWKTNVVSTKLKNSTCTCVPKDSATGSGWALVLK